MRLIRLKQNSPAETLLQWDDGHESPISLKTLRDHCPCAGCSGETMMFRSYVPPPAQTDTPGRYEMKSAIPVGNYALKFTWGDGHDLGIYTWEHLRSLCECEVCAERRRLTEG